MIADEARWREWMTAPDGQAAAAVSALEIARIYRALRKGLEDTKNEPGAADFYYPDVVAVVRLAIDRRLEQSDSGKRARHA